ncbi:uncharacterized protein RCC_11081 [Ramularia collo-cygni]|uniref:GH64 domain-containing protein n=1 Tax=Ramularia collo-cygni TaxID=112498 RepID=A0A2D3VIU2_9PEZI|nr:uncharacterized protein RCC_11081 [Ramularia collo-cygni]CZT25352.1 uncharacterized protein RCC_11081 [Ramularia collo-cygni]
MMPSRRESTPLLVALLALGLLGSAHGAPMLNADQPFPIYIPVRPGQKPCDIYVFGEQNGRDVFLSQTSQYEAVNAAPGQPQPEQLYAHAQGSVMSLPVGDLSSGRIYAHCGGKFSFMKVIDAAGKSKIQPTPAEDAVYNFVELTTTRGTIYIDISAVDMLGNPPLGYKLEGGHTGKQAWGANPGSLDRICADLQSQSNADGMPWEHLCVERNGEILRILSPGEYMKNNPSAFEDYFNAHARAVYTQWNAQPKQYNLGNVGNVTCVGAADGSSATCNGRSYGLPTSADVFGCASGPFAAVAAPGDPHEALRAPFCADFNRGTAMSSDAATSPQNWYSTAVHKELPDIYTFPFDDVRVDGLARDSTLTSSSATGLTIIIGGTWPDEYPG